MNLIKNTYVKLLASIMLLILAGVSYYFLTNTEIQTEELNTEVEVSSSEQMTIDELKTKLDILAQDEKTATGTIPSDLETKLTELNQQSEESDDEAVSESDLENRLQSLE